MSNVMSNLQIKYVKFICFIYHLLEIFLPVLRNLPMTESYAASYKFLIASFLHFNASGCFSH